MDVEDGYLIAEAGARLNEIAKLKNPSMYRLFRERCHNNGEEPETVLGMYAYRFLREAVDSEESEFIEELLSSRVNVSAVRSKRSLREVVEELREIRDVLYGEDDVDKEINTLITEMIKSVASSVKSPIERIAEQPSKNEPVINLSEISTDELAALLNEVKAELEDRIAKAQEVSVVEQKEEQEVESEGDNRDSGGVDDRSGETIQESEGDRSDRRDTVDTDADATKEVEGGDDTGEEQSEDNTGSGNGDRT